MAESAAVVCSAVPDFGHGIAASVADMDVGYFAFDVLLVPVSDCLFAVFVFVGSDVRFDFALGYVVVLVAAAVDAAPDSAFQFVVSAAIFSALQLAFVFAVAIAAVPFCCFQSEKLCFADW